MSLVAWRVLWHGKEIDTVYFDEGCDADYVLKSLVEHDGYRHGIEVREDGVKRRLGNV